MTRHRNALSNERGFALFYMAVFLTVLLIFVGLAVDTGRAYVVQAQLSKAVDGAALGAARMLNSGNPEQEAGNIYRANFPTGYMGTTSSTTPGASGFFAMTTDATTGVNVVNVRATAVVPTTFMQLANFTELTVHAQGEATRRMVDLSLVLDVSSSIGSKWGAVRDASRAFVDGFAAAQDRVSLIFYSNGARVVDAMPAGRGFDKARVMADIPDTLPGGSTAMVEGLYRGWDELRSVPNGQQSGLRVIVLFTDGASNSVPGIYPNPGSSNSRGLRTYDFPDTSRSRRSDARQPDDHRALRHAERRGTPQCLPSDGVPLELDIDRTPRRAAAAADELPLLPSKRRNSDVVSAREQHADGRRRFASVETADARERRSAAGIPTQIFNINNAARNLVEIIANEARNDASGDYRIRIYTIGMGYARAAPARDAARDVGEHAHANRQRRHCRPTTSRPRLSSKASTTTPRPKRTSPRRSRRCRTRSSV